MKKVIKSKGLTIVKFGTDWSGACQMMAPIYEELASTFKNRAKFYDVFLDEHRELFAQYDINEYPTIIFFMNGEPVEQIKGTAAKRMVAEKIETVLSTDYIQN